MQPLRMVLLDATAPTWPDTVAAVRQALRAHHAPYLFPTHFIQVVLPAIGGGIVRLEQGGQAVGYGFLFPRGLDGDTPVFTLRYHSLDPNTPLRPATLEEAGKRGPRPLRVVPYDPRKPHPFTPTHRPLDDLDLGHPDEHEAHAIPRLQQEIWGNPSDELYPADIHSDDFRLATSLVARLNGAVVGFLFGCYRLDGHPLPRPWMTHFRTRLRIESQTMGVLPGYRGRGIGFQLKRLQAEQALAQDIHIVHWTVDPLQWPNAVLNFARLGAVAYEFHPDYYPLRNRLNRIAASRFRLTWLVASPRVRPMLQGRPVDSPLDLTQEPDIVLVNDGPGGARFHVQAPRIAIEIPANWTEIQWNHPAIARRWRAVTDKLFGAYLGITPDRYMVTHVGTAGQRCYLVAQRVGDIDLETFVHAEE